MTVGSRPTTGLLALTNFRIARNLGLIPYLIG
jgi:hypothetical protein